MDAELQGRYFTRKRMNILDADYGKLLESSHGQRSFPVDSLVYSCADLRIHMPTLHTFTTLRESEIFIFFEEYDSERP